ncbi:hypothetical protein IV102_15150 [bacterium]|nr:hypothetical protein [bacterium]
MSNLISTANGNVFAPGLKDRAANQHARAAQGVASGSLTGSEVGVLKDMRSDARASLAEAKGNNGWVGPKERKELHQDMNSISQTIYALKHN